MEEQSELHDPDLDQARADLYVGLETSRAIVRQSRLLLELSESDGLATVGELDLIGD